MNTWGTPHIYYPEASVLIMYPNSNSAGIIAQKAFALCWPECLGLESIRLIGPDCDKEAINLAALGKRIFIHSTVVEQSERSRQGGFS